MSILSNLNIFSNFKLSGLSSIGSILLLLALAGLILVILVVLVFILASKKTYWIRIHVFRLIGNTPTRIGVFCAKEEDIGKAGDKLWRVAPMGFSMPFKIIKWLPVGKYQTSAREFWYWIREDGEWINFTLDNLDTLSEKMGIKFIQEDMRLSRLSTDRLLHERFLKKNFWERYGGIIMYMIFFLVITVAMVIIFYQWSKIIDQTQKLIGVVSGLLQQYSQGGLIPAG